MKTKKQIRKEITRNISEIYAPRKTKEIFVPGETLIEYVGRVYDEKEIVNFVDASLGVLAYGRKIR